jgi:hypothetical protein
MSAEVRKLIRTIAAANPLWGAPRIHGRNKVKVFIYISCALLVDSGTQSTARGLQHEALYLQVPSTTQDVRCYAV